MRKYNTFKNLLPLLFALLLGNYAQSQSFTGSGGAIPDGGPQLCFPVTVSGVGTINGGALGLTRACINISHTFTSDLVIKLKSPDGTMITLSDQNGGGGNNYSNTCFSEKGEAGSIKEGTTPFSGSFIPEENLGAVNNGQNANGTWYLCIQDMNAGDAGRLVNFTLNFRNGSPAPT